MSANNKMDQQKLSVCKAAVAALVGSLCCFFLVSAILASTMVKGNFNGDAAQPMALASLAVGGFSASWIAVKILHHGALPCVLTSFLVYAVLPILISALSGQIELSAFLGLRIVLLLLCSLMGGLLGIKTTVRKKVH